MANEASIGGIKPPQPFTLQNTTAANWRLFKQRWDNYSVLTNLHAKSQTLQVALFLHCLADDALAIYNGFSFPSNEPTCDDIIAKFNDFAIGELNTSYERYVFNKRIQAEGENFETFLASIRTLVKTCNYCAKCVDSILRDRIILGIRDCELQKSLLKERDISLSAAINQCKAVETAQTCAHSFQHAEDAIHRIEHSKTQNPMRNKRAKPQTCKFCKSTHILRKQLCPAWGARCHDCGQRNHFGGSSVCQRVKRVNTIDNNTSDTDSEYEEICIACEMHISAQSTPAALFCDMTVNKHKVKLQIDSGASVCVLPERYVRNKNIRPEPVKLKMWNSTTVVALGKCKVLTVNIKNGRKYLVDYVIVKENLTPLISNSVAEKMNLISINYDNFAFVCAVKTTHDLLNNFPNVFDGELGKIPGNKVELSLLDCTPVIRPARTIPEALKPRVLAELNRLENQGVIKKVDAPTDWVSQMSVAEKKSGSLRICIDPRPLNLALKREHFRLPTLDDILPMLSKASKFSVFDLSQGYLQCELSDSSRLLTTFSTPFGRYAWNRLPFGLKVSSEIFQKRLHQALDGLTGFACVADDVIVFGFDQEDHDRNVCALLNRCNDLGIKLNREKSQLNLDEIHFQGHVISNHGLKPDPDKVSAITSMPRPTDKDAVHRLRGTITYLSRFVPKLTDVIRPITQLLRDGVEWTWSEAQENSFSEIKRLISESPVLVYFNPDKQLEIQCDASSQGLGAALLQDGRPIAYTSRALTEVETRYAVIEKEMLAVVYALEKWHQYTYGRYVIVYSDHKPLEVITKKTLDKAPKRLQGMLLRALAYDIIVTYKEGKSMLLADALSRAHLPTDRSDQSELETINAVTSLSMSTEDINDIIKSTACDATLQTLKDTILNGWPDHKDQIHNSITPYFNMKDELSFVQGLVFRGERLVIPTALRNKLKKELHVGHTGIESCLKRARETLYWPNMNAEIKDFVQNCETCREFDQAQQKETLMCHEVPDRPWQKVGIDLFEYKNKHYLITVDYRSNFWEIDYLHSTTSAAVICKIKNHFARYGIADTVVTDNGPQFSSQEFNRFRNAWGFTHTPSSPHFPQSNGKAESAVKTAKRMIRKCRHSGEDQYLALLNIRNTPTGGMETSPAQASLFRRTKTTLPTASVLLEPTQIDAQHQTSRLRQRQEQQKKYYNHSARDLSPLYPGDCVRVRPYKLGDDVWKKATVVQRLDERSYRVRARDGALYRRNRVHLRASSERPPLIMPTTLDVPPMTTTRPAVTHDVHGEEHQRAPVEDTCAPRRSGRERRVPEKYTDFVM